MDRHQELLSLYNELDESLRAYYKESDYSRSVITRFIKDLNHSGIKEYELYARKLNMIRIIRNDLIHDLDMNKEHLVEVTDDAIDFLKVVLEYVKNPISARDACTKLKDSHYISNNELSYKVLPVMQEMRKVGFTQLPILGKHNEVVGVFSPNVFFDYVAHHDKELGDITLNDLLDYLPLEKHFSESYLFVSANTNISEVAENLIQAHEQNKKPVMIFVTQSGQIKEPLIGIIVFSDIVKTI